MTLVSKKSILRAIDANVNRASEGVRVVEDVVRFQYDDALLSSKLREIRHMLRKTAGALPGGNCALAAARDSAGDVARNSKHIRTSESPDSLAANLKRAQEATRVLEEMSKQLSQKTASHFGEIRFRLYDIEKDLYSYLNNERYIRKLPSNKFVYSVAGFNDYFRNGSYSLLRQLIKAGVGMIQLREKGIDDVEALKHANKISGIIRKSESLFVVNDRVDLALAAGADAVHLGQEDIPIKEARAIAGERLLIGYSTHTYRQAMKALESRPDYISVGPIFSSPTKPEKKPVGLKLLEKVTSISGDIPVVAIGGISMGNLERVYSSGAKGAAMISELTNNNDLKSTLDRINSIVEKADVVSSKGNING
ncbi:MAG TPA: thiamine phosphate synthase [bacterium]|nr:thiamine phosphate synthase [bacterium]